MENKILMVQNADHVQAMTNDWIEDKKEEFERSKNDETLFKKLLAKVMGAGVYWLADDFLKQFNQGTKDFKTKWHERESAIPGFFERNNIMNMF